MIERLLWLFPILIAAAGVWRPRVGIIVLAAGLPLFGSPPGGPYLAPLDAAVLAAVATAWRGGSGGSSSLRWPIAAVLATSVVSLLPLAYHPPSLEPRLLAGLLAALPGVQTWTILHTWRGLANLLLGLALYLAIRRSFSGRSLRPLGLALAAGLAATLALGLAETAGLVDLGAYRAIGGALYETRLHSLFFHSGWLAQFVVAAGPPAVAALLAGGPRLRWAGLALVALVLVTLLLTQQRGAWYATLAQLGVVALILGRELLQDRRRRSAAVAAVAITIVVGGAVAVLAPDAITPVVDRARTAVSDLSGRPALWSAAVAMTGERPLAGWGIGAFGPAYDTFFPPGSSEAFPYRATAHNFYLTVSTERGILGLTAFALLAWALARILLPAARDGVGRHRLPSVALILSFSGLAFYGAVQYFFHLHNTELLFWMLVAAASLLEPEPVPLRSSPRALAQAIVILALVLVPVRLLAYSNLIARGDGTYGFNEPEAHAEGPIQWTTGRSARRIPWQGETLIVRLANGHPAPADHPALVTLRAAGQLREVTLNRGGWREVELPVGAADRPWLVLQIRVEPTFRPFREFRGLPDVPPSHDIRELGVAFGGSRWLREATPGSTP